MSNNPAGILKLRLIIWLSKLAFGYKQQTLTKTAHTSVGEHCSANSFDGCLISTDEQF